MATKKKATKKIEARKRATKKTAERRALAKAILETKPIGRPGALTEQVLFRMSKATAKRLTIYQHKNGHETRADALRAVLRTAGI